MEIVEMPLGEALQEYFRFNKFKAFQIECSGTFCDLREPVQRARWKICLAELKSDPPSERCRDLGNTLRRSGMFGIIYWSNRDPKGTCVAVFLENTKEALRWNEVANWNRLLGSNGLRK